MYSAQFENYGAEYEIFAAILLFYLMKIKKVSQRVWNKKRKTKEIERCILEEYKGDSFENLINIGNFYKLNIHVYWRKRCIFQTDTTYDDTLRITTTEKNRLKNVKVFFDMEEVVYR